MVITRFTVKKIYFAGYVFMLCCLRDYAVQYKKQLIYIFFTLYPNFLSHEFELLLELCFKVYLHIQQTRTAAIKTNVL